MHDPILLAQMSLRLPVSKISRVVNVTLFKFHHRRRNSRLYQLTSNVSISSDIQNSMNNLNENILYYGRKRQTNVSLRALLDTGTGNYLDKLSSKSSESTVTSEKILIQVRAKLNGVIDRKSF